VLAHPQRAAVFRVIASEGKTTPTQVARKLGVRVENVSYHVRVLAEHGFIELADTTPVRGSVAHWYRAVDGVDDGTGSDERLLAGMATVPRSARDEFRERIGALLDELNEAARAEPPSPDDPLVAVSWLVDLR
jgi:DNA-binding transcriptional ArsR family regulator